MAPAPAPAPEVARSWSTATLVETSDSGSALYPQIAYGAGGTALAVWLQEAGSGSARSVWASRYTLATGWAAPALLETDDTGNADAPQVAFDAAGNAMAIWTQPDSERNKVWVARYTAGAWSAPVAIDGGGNVPDQPRIALDANGNALAVWSDFASGRENIRANRYTAGAGWGAAQLIETDDAGSAYEPQVAFDAGGNAIAVWYQGNGARFGIRANRYTAGGGWGTAVQIDPPDAAASLYPQVVLDAAGNALAVWQQSDGTGQAIWSARYAAAGGWGAAQRIGTTSTDFIGFVQIARDAAGNAFAVWSQGATPLVLAARFSPGSGWGAPTAISGPNAYRPQVAFDRDGNATAVWSEVAGGVRYTVTTSRYTPAAGWTAPQAIGSPSGGDAEFAQLAVGPDGDAAVVWQQRRPGTVDDDIWTNVFR